MVSKLKLISVADILTFCNGLCGFLAIIAFIWYYPDITIGTGLMFIGIVFDGLDGAAARKFGTKHDYGRHLDSIADAFTFVIAPTVLVFSVFLIKTLNAPIFSLTTFRNPRNILVLLTGSFVIFFGLKRLTIYTTLGYKLKNFHGLATPALAFYIIVISHILDPHRPENDSVILSYFSILTILFGAVLMSSPLKYPKIRGKIGAALALAIIISLLSIEAQKWLGIGSADDIFFYYRIISFCGLGLVICYIFFSPVILYFKKNAHSSY